MKKKDPQSVSTVVQDPSSHHSHVEPLQDPAKDAEWNRVLEIDPETGESALLPGIQLRRIYDLFLKELKEQQQESGQPSPVQAEV